METITANNVCGSHRRELQMLLGANDAARSLIQSDEVNSGDAGTSKLNEKWFVDHLPYDLVWLIVDLLVGNRQFRNVGISNRVKVALALWRDDIQEADFGAYMDTAVPEQIHHYVELVGVVDSWVVRHRPQNFYRPLPYISTLFEFKDLFNAAMHRRLMSNTDDELDQMYLALRADEVVLIPAVPIAHGFEIELWDIRFDAWDRWVDLLRSGLTVKHLKSIIIDRRLMSVALKAMMFEQFGRFIRPVAAYSSMDEMSSQIGVHEWAEFREQFYKWLRQKAVVEPLQLICELLVEACLGLLALVQRCLSLILERRWPVWTWVLAEAITVAMFIVFIGSLVLRLCGCCTRKRVLAPSRAAPPISNGKELEILLERLAARLLGVQNPRPEMAIAGSEFRNAKRYPIGVIAVQDDEDPGKMHAVGTFWRYRDFLITARHVADTVEYGTAAVYLVGPEDKQGAKTVKLSQTVVGVEPGWFNDRGNLIGRVDVFARRLDSSCWSTLRMSQFSVRGKSAYNQSIIALGFVDGVLKQSTGITLPGSGFDELWHTASTIHGHSGGPILFGNSVIGVHCAAGDRRNIAVRIEHLLAQLPALEQEADRGGSEMPEHEEQRRVFKFRGREVEVRNGGEHVDIMDDRGVVELDVDQAIYASEFPQVMLAKQQRKLDARNVSYDDEAALVFGTVGCRELESDGLVQHPREARVHCNATPKDNVEVVAYLADKQEELKSLGFEEGVYEYPRITPELEEESLRKHLKLYRERLAQVKRPPSEAEINRCVNIMVTVMEELAFSPVPGYKSVDRLLDVINSSAVKVRKSPGHPYQEAGLMTNGQVLAHYGNTAFCEKVLADWRLDNPAKIRLKIFLKVEANKRKKIVNGMPRLVAGFPLHEMVINQAIFREKLDVAVRNWDKSPKAYAFNPVVPGHIAHLARKHRGRQYESDKPNWDYMMYKYHWEISKRVNEELAVQHPDMSDAEFAEWKRDAAKRYDRACSECVFRCTNGVVLENPDGMQKSGNLLTIDSNTEGQMSTDILTKMRLGWDDKKIVESLAVSTFGGDDGIQEFPDDMDLDAYIAAAADLGVPMEFTISDSLEGACFYSNRFHYNPDLNVWMFKPVRFTKHIAKMCKTKLADLASALSNHMKNYVWDRRKFEFFNHMFHDLRKIHGDELFPLKYCKTRRFLQYSVLGLESQPAPSV